MKSFSINVGDILDPTTVYGLATKNLINKTIHKTNTKNASISKTSKKKFFNFILVFTDNHITNF